MTDAVGLLRELVSIASVTATAGEKQAVAWVAQQLSRQGIPARLIGDPERPNLVAHFRGSDPTLRPLVLLSHLDVAPVEPSAWSHPPFGGETEHGRLYGRGTLDTKQLTIMELLAFCALYHGGGTRRDVYLVATVDEEQGSTMGAALLAHRMPELFQKAVVLSEGGGFPLVVGGKPYLTLVVGEKCACRVRLTAKGQAGHAAAPGPEQAVVRLSAALGALLTGVEQLPPSGPVQGAMASLVGEAPDNRLASELLAYAGCCGVSAPPFQLGAKVNVLPATAGMALELRPLPNTSRAQVEGWLSAWLEGQAVAWEMEWFQPGILCPPEDRLTRSVIATVEQASRKHGLAAQALPMLALGRTDGRFFGEGSAVFGFSPLGLMDTFDRILPMVHGNDESVSIAGFTFGCAVFAELAARLAMEVDD